MGDSRHACRIAQMSDLRGKPKTQGGMFSEPADEKSFPTVAVTIAAVAVALVVAALVVIGKRDAKPNAPNTLQAMATYASNLEFSHIELSEATSLTGGKSTYIDGHVANHGPATVTGITVQVVFTNDEQMPPQLETVGLPLVYMRDPYIDTRPVGAAPLAAGAEADFRLVFEGIQPNWDQKPPEIRVTRVTTK
jgi:hypothetical protein